MGQPRRRTDMGGTGVVDRFLDVFTRYIDSGFAADFENHITSRNKTS